MLKNFAGLLAVSALTLVAASAQSSTNATASQTARQALIEMFFSETPGTFMKHLPAATFNALEKSGAMTTLQQYSVLAGQLHTQGKSVETFDHGAILLAANDPKNGSKFEIDVEKDSLQGDTDDIEVSFQAHQNNQLQTAPPSFLPRVTFVMKMESGVWKLNEILMTLRLPLADPDFLKSVTDGIKSRSAPIAPALTQVQTSTSMTASGGNPSVQAAMRTILAAEATYHSAYPTVGYTCSLSDLDGFGGGQPNEHQAMLIPSGLASGRKFGYVFTLSGCTGTPATSFHLVVTPAANGSGWSAFCSDQTATIRNSADDPDGVCFGKGSVAR